MFRNTYRCAALACGAVFTASAAMASPIAISNAGFEGPTNGDGTPFDYGINIYNSGTGGGTGTTPTVSTDFNHEAGGSHSLKVTMPGHDTTTEVYDFNTAAAGAMGDATTPVTFSLWMYEAQQVDQGLFAIQIEFKHTVSGGGDTGVGASNDTFVFGPDQLTLGDWKQITFAVTPNAAFDEVLFHVKAIGFNGSQFAPTGVVYYDDATAFVGAVPEPTSLSIVAIGAMGLLSHRRRTNRHNVD